MENTAATPTMLSHGEEYDLIVDVVGDEDSLEFATLSAHLLDGDSLDASMALYGTNWEDINPLLEEYEENARELRKQKNPLSKGVPVEPTGEDCPVCPTGELVKPRSEKPRCPSCLHVKNGNYADLEMVDFDLTYRQAKRVLGAFGYDNHGSPGSIGTRLRHLCNDHPLDVDEFNDLLADLRGDGYEQEDVDDE